MKRPHMPLSVKLKAALIQLQLDPDNVDFDHAPPLALRTYDSKTGLYSPDANDPRYIQALSREAHALKTNGPAATSAGGDKHMIAKAKRIAGGGKKRRGPKIRSRPFQSKKDWLAKAKANGPAER